MWNHNIHFHNYLLSQLPKKTNRVLDVGCGNGLLAWKLAKISDTVDPIDCGEMILKEALNQHNASNIYYKQADFLQTHFSEDYFESKNQDTTDSNSLLITHYSSSQTTFSANPTYYFELITYVS